MNSQPRISLNQGRSAGKMRANIGRKRGKVSQDDSQRLERKWKYQDYASHLIPVGKGHSLVALTIGVIAWLISESRTLAIFATLYMGYPMQGQTLEEGGINRIHIESGTNTEDREKGRRQARATSIASNNDVAQQEAIATFIDTRILTSDKALGNTNISRKEQRSNEKDMSHSRDPSSTQKQKATIAAMDNNKAAIVDMERLAEIIGSAIGSSNIHAGLQNSLNVREFNGESVTDFLKEFETKMMALKVIERDWVKWVVKFVGPGVRNQVKALIEGYDWEDAKKELTIRYHATDWDQMETALSELETINSQRPQTVVETYDWLIKHRYLWRKVEPQGWAIATSQSNSLYKAFPADLINGFMDKAKLIRKDVIRRPYQDLWGEMKQYVETRLETEQRDAPSREQLQVRPEARQQKPAARREQTQVSLQTQDDQMAILARQMADLKIALAKSEAKVVDLASREERRFHGRNERSHGDRRFRPQQGHTNAAFIHRQDEYSSEEANELTVASIGGSNGTRMFKCHYCNEQGHYPDQCEYYKHDRAIGFCTYNTAARLLSIGRRDGENIVPPSLVGRFISNGSCVRRLAVYWIEAFPNCFVAPLVKQVKERSCRHQPQWDVDESERITLDKFMSLEESKRWEPRAISQEDILSRPKDAPTTAVIAFSNTQLPKLQQELLICAAPVAVNANERKRVRVEEVQDDEEVPAGTRTPLPDKPVRKAIDPKAMTKSVDVPEQIAQRALQQIHEEALQKKVGIPLRTLCKLLPDLGRSVGFECVNQSEGIDRVIFQPSKPAGTVAEKDKYIANAIMDCDQMACLLNEVEDTSVITREPRIEQEQRKHIEETDSRLWELIQERMNGKVKETSYETKTQRSNGLARGSQAIQTNAAMVERKLGYMQDLPYIQVRLGKDNGPLLPGLIDSGSQANIISMEYAKHAGLKIIPVQTKTSTTSYSNQAVNIHGEIQTKLYLGNAWVDVQLYVGPNSVLVPLILGMPFIRKTQLTLDHSMRSGDLLVKCRFGNVQMVTTAAGGIIWENATTPLKPRAVKTNVITLCADQSAANEAIGQEAITNEDQMVIGLDDVEGIKVIQMIIDKGFKEIDDETGFKPNRNQKRQAADVERKLGKAVNLYANTLYKRKGHKVHPRDDIPSDGTTPEGDPDWKRKKWDEAKGQLKPSRLLPDQLVGRIAAFPAGTRLTPERLEEILKPCRGTLSKKELKVFEEILWNREGALAWDFSECGKLDPLVAPPQVIKVVDHKAWQAGAIPIPLGLQAKLVDLLKLRLKHGIFEESHGPYRNPYFLVVKKDGGVRFILSATKYNGITIRDAYIPPRADKFSEDYGMCKILSVIDFLSGYDQIPLDRRSRDLTTIATAIGLLRLCTLPQGATNSVAQFMRVVVRILFDLIPDVCQPFLDDIAVKGPTTTYQDEEAAPGIRRYILEHLVNLDKVLLNIELAGCTISAKKSKFCQQTAALVGYMCGTYGRQPTTDKIVKVLEWTVCKDQRDVRGFLGMIGFYRIWIKGFAQVARPLSMLLRKGVEWQWESEQQDAMDELKAALTSPPVLATLDLDEGHGEVILATDASGVGWGCKLEQVLEGKRHPIRFESGIWTAAEINYDATKQECRAVLYALRRLRSQLYGVHFTLETDSQVLVHQLNGAVNDIPGALVTRWLSYIMLFDFTAKHVPGQKNTVADGLSRKGPGPSDQLDREVEGDVEEFIDLRLNTVQLPSDTPKYAADMARIAEFLQTWEKPIDLTAQQYRRLRLLAKRFFFENGCLWRRPNLRDKAPALVVDNPHDKIQLIKRTHETLGHKGVEVTFQSLRQRYWWQSLWNDIKAAIACCEKCQRFAPWRPRELAFPTAPGSPMSKIHIDTQYMPFDRGYKYLLEARCDLTGWVEAKPVAAINVLAVKRFLANIIGRYGLIPYVVMDGGPEMRGDLDNQLSGLGIKAVRTSGYNPKANGLVEAGHWSLASALAKLARSNGSWHRYLDNALLADRTAVRASHGKSAFYLIYGWEPILPLEVEYPTWRLINWDLVVTKGDLFEARLRVLQRKSEDVAKARDRVQAFRKTLAQRTDANHAHSLRKEKDVLNPGDLVLVYDVRRSTDMSRSAKLAMRWGGPFRIVSRAAVTGAYRIQTLDGIQLDKTIAGEHLKKFTPDPSGWWASTSDDWLLQDRGALELRQKNQEDAVDEILLHSPARIGQDQTVFHDNQSAACIDDIDDRADGQIDCGSSDGEAENTENESRLKRAPAHHLEVQIPLLPSDRRAEYEAVSVPILLIA